MKTLLAITCILFLVSVAFSFCMYRLMTDVLVETVDITLSEAPIQIATDANDLEQRVNKIRASYHLQPLTICDCLRSAAKTRADEMLASGTFSHTRPNGDRFVVGTWCDYGVRGENLAMDFETNAGIINAWMESPGHREIILNPRYTHFGIGVAGTYTAFEVGY